MSRALALLLIVALVLFACVSRLRSAPAVPATVTAELARLLSEPLLDAQPRGGPPPGEWRHGRTAALLPHNRLEGSCCE